MYMQLYNSWACYTYGLLSLVQEIIEILGYKNDVTIILYYNPLS